MAAHLTFWLACDTADLLTGVHNAQTDALWEVAFTPRAVNLYCHRYRADIQTLRSDCYRFGTCTIVYMC